ncbi:MAG: NAD-dependent deacylase [Ignavibacteriales bacterium]|nr:NAD-dependent deacylase [Ignavibacteriales bacterium]
MMVSHRLKHILRQASSMCVLTGAGISAESGVPTFRGKDGLWKKFKPEELANFDAFIRNPELVWEWYSYRKRLIDNVRPGAGHTALAELERFVPRFTLVTQNVDNLHQRAGSKRVLELHGNIERSYCIACGSDANEEHLNRTEGVPRCERCGGLVRPAVVWFGELLPHDVFNEAEEAARWCDVFLCVGTSAVVYPAAALPATAKHAGAYVVEVNMERTDISHYVDESLIGLAGTILPELVGILREEKEKIA